MGQFFFEKPDKKFFKKQAAQYNFDEAKYLKALSEVPVFSREKIDKALEFLKNLAELIIEMGASHKELLEISEELEQRVQKRTAHLQKALDEIKTLRGILPLCSFCKKVRNDDGYWEQVDIYIHKYSQADISHSICPECLKEHYPEYAK